MKHHIIAHAEKYSHLAYFSVLFIEGFSKSYYAWIGGLLAVLLILSTFTGGHDD